MVLRRVGETNILSMNRAMSFALRLDDLAQLFDIGLDLLKVPPSGLRHAGVSPFRTQLPYHTLQLLDLGGKRYEQCGQFFRGRRQAIALSHVAQARSSRISRSTCSARRA
jgi:hypothetical protein